MTLSTIWNEIVAWYDLQNIALVFRPDISLDAGVLTIESDDGFTGSEVRAIDAIALRHGVAWTVWSTRDGASLITMREEEGASAQISTHAEMITGPSTHTVRIVQEGNGREIIAMEVSLKEAEQLSNDLKAMVEACFVDRLIHGDIM